MEDPFAGLWGEGLQLQRLEDIAPTETAVLVTTLLTVITEKCREHRLQVLRKTPLGIAQIIYYTTGNTQDNFSA